MASWTRSKLLAMTGSSEQLPPDPPRPSAKAAERLAVIVDAAERAALAVIDDAEREAQRYLEEAQGRADLVVAARLREEAERLELRAAAVDPAPSEPEPGEPRLRKVGSPDLDKPSPPIPPPPPFAPITPDEEAQSQVGTQSAGGSAAARLLATQMAVTGSSRDEIAMRLRNGFEIEDTGEILDAILGPEGA